jgi:tRNA threonylcarbamoyladenosine biosynthesis protein TsaB
MIILTLRTDKPESELGLYDGQTKIVYETWQAHRQLAETIHQKLRDLLQGQQKKLEDIQGIVIYKGPGSFTGLRIGLSVANALAYSLDIPIAATTGDDWIAQGIQRIQEHPSKKSVAPEYGSPVHITTPRK